MTGILRQKILIQQLIDLFQRVNTLNGMSSDCSLYAYLTEIYNGATSNLTVLQYHMTPKDYSYAISCGSSDLICVFVYRIRN